METISVTGKKHKKYLKEQDQRFINAQVLMEQGSEMHRRTAENLWKFLNKYYPETKTGQWSFCSKTHTISKTSDGDNDYDLG